MARQSLTPYRSGGTDLYRGGDPFLSLHRQMNRLFDDAFRDFGTGGIQANEELQGVLAPRIDITEHDKEICITAEMPGVREEDVDLSVEGDMLTLRAEKKVERKEEGTRRHVSERAYGTFQRALRLPWPVDPDAVQAHFDGGVLTVRLPRNAEAERSRRITLQKGAPPQAEKEPKESTH